MPENRDVELETPGEQSPELTEGNEQATDQEEHQDSSTDSSSSVTDDGNVWSTDGLEEPMIARIKSGQSLYTKTSQEKAVLQSKYDELAQGMQQLRQEVNRTLDNPTVYDYYRAQRGLAPINQVKPVDAPDEHESAPALDLEGAESASEVSRRVMEYEAKRDAYRDRMWEARTKEMVDKAIASTEERFAPVAKSVSDDRWYTALDNMKSKYSEHFASVESQVLQHISHGAYGP